MRGYRAALVAAAVLASGCVTQRDQYFDAVVRAQARWETACGLRPVPTSVIVQDQATVECGRFRASGCTDTTTGVVWLASRASAPVAGLVLHELGHVLGAGHLPVGQHGVMISHLSNDAWRPCITPDDLDAVGWCPVRRPECP